MQKRHGLALFAGLAIILAACGSGTASTAPSTAALKPIKVGVVTDVGQLEDKSFNQSSNEGAKAAATEAGGTHDVIVTQAISDYAANIQTLIDADFDVIVTVGFLIGTDTAKAAKANPTVKFVGVDQGVCVDANGEPDPTFACAGDAATLLPNYQGIVFAEAQPGYLAGIVAASLTKSGTIGAVGGTNVPAVVNYWRGYENGAKSVKPDIKVLYQETDPNPAIGFNDPAKGKTIAGTVHRPGRRRHLPDRRPDRPGRARGRLRGRGCLGHRRRRRPGRQPPEPRQVHRHQRREEARRHGQGRRPERRLGHVQGGHRPVQRGVDAAGDRALVVTTTTRR